MAWNGLKLFFGEIQFAHRLIDIRVYYICCCFYVEPSNLYQVQSDIQNVKSIHAKLNPITVFLRGKDIDFLTLSKTQTLKTLITLKFSAFRGTTLSIKVELLVLLEALAFILKTNTALYVEKN